MKKLILAITLVMMSSGIQLMRGASEVPAAPAIFAHLEGKEPNLHAFFESLPQSAVNEFMLTSIIKPISAEDAAENQKYLLVVCRTADSKELTMGIATDNVEELALCKNVIRAMFAGRLSENENFCAKSFDTLSLQEDSELFWGIICFCESDDESVFCVTHIIEGEKDYQKYVYPVNYNCSCLQTSRTLIVIPLGEDCVIS